MALGGERAALGEKSQDLLLVRCEICGHESTLSSERIADATKREWLVEPVSPMLARKNR